MSAAALHGLVLAGGRSRRFGRDKAALQVGGEALLPRLAALLAPLVTELRVSVRPDQQHEALRAEFDLLLDGIEDGGPAAGLLAAHAHAPAAAWLVIACDLPLLDRELLADLVARRDPGREATAFESPADGQPEPLCAIYEPALLARLAKTVAAGGDLSPRRLLAAADTLLLSPQRAEALANVNRPADLEALQNRGLC